MCCYHQYFIYRYDGIVNAIDEEQSQQYKYYKDFNDILL